MSSHGFDLILEREIPELKTRARFFRHLKTGAELLSLENDDENKVFGITFRTPPTDSTGVAHIMEHSVLCGSRKYPLKEPFVELIKGSLNTFLNAMTYPDKTTYPVASQNLQDFYNLIDVYMDAVLYPLISPQTLEQEGWHYELENVDAPLTYKGVVFNEMKGNYSSPDSLLAEETQQSLFPDTVYSVDSGGDPREIPNLTYAQFKAFHDTYYHPSNARIYFYGDDDPEERLRRMDEYLREFDALPVDSAIPLQPPFAAPKQVEIPYDAGQEPDGKKSMLTTNWLLPEITDPPTRLGLQILTYILIGTPASPLRKALIDSGLGEDLTGGGLLGELRQMYFSTGLKGIALETAGQVETLILDKLADLARQGIDPDMIAAAVNTSEFRLRENNTGSFPRGLSLMLRSLSAWLYNRDPLGPLAFESSLAAIKERLASGERYFEGLIQQYLLENSHRTTVILKPEPGIRQREEAAEADRLSRVREVLRPEELQAMVEETRQLKLRQETPDSPEALASIPSLKLEDLERQNKLIPLALSTYNGTQLLYHDLFTNGILYLDIGLNLHILPQEFLPFVPLFSRALLEMGTQREDFVKLSQHIGRTTGGIRPASFTSAIRDQQGTAAWLFLRGKATMGQVDDLLAILGDVLLTARLDNRERFRQIVLEEKADAEAGLVPGGARVVNTRLRAQLGEAGWAAEQMGGVNYLEFVRQLADRIDADWPGVLAQLEQMRAILLDRKNMLCNITLDADNWRQVQPRLKTFLEALPAGSNLSATWRPQEMAPYEGLVIPAQINYVGKGADLYHLGYKLDGSAAVITNHLRTTWLWEKVRMQGGAYGAFSIFDHRSGVFTLVSYRDPNLLSTLEVYDQSGQFLRHLELSREELTKSIIGTIGDLDAYQLPDAKGYTSMLRYLAGDSEQSRQLFREQILDTSVEDFHAFGEVLEAVADAGRVVVLGSEENIQNASQARDGWLAVKKVL